MSYLFIFADVLSDLVLHSHVRLRMFCPLNTARVGGVDVPFQMTAFAQLEERCHKLLLAIGFNGSLTAWPAALRGFDLRFRAVPRFESEARTPYITEHGFRPEGSPFVQDLRKLPNLENHGISGLPDHFRRGWLAKTFLDIKSPGFFQYMDLTRQKVVSICQFYHDPVIMLVGAPEQLLPKHFANLSLPTFNMISDRMFLLAELVGETAMFKVDRIVRTRKQVLEVAQPSIIGPGADEVHEGEFPQSADAAPSLLDLERKDNIAERLSLEADLATKALQHAEFRQRIILCGRLAMPKSQVHMALFRWLHSAREAAAISGAKSVEEQMRLSTALWIREEGKRGAAHLWQPSYAEMFLKRVPKQLVKLLEFQESVQHFRDRQVNRQRELDRKSLTADSSDAVNKDESAGKEAEEDDTTISSTTSGSLSQFQNLFRNLGLQSKSSSSRSSGERSSIQRADQVLQSLTHAIGLLSPTHDYHVPSKQSIANFDELIKIVSESLKQAHKLVDLTDYTGDSDEDEVKSEAATSSSTAASAASSSKPSVTTFGTTF